MTPRLSRVRLAALLGASILSVLVTRLPLAPQHLYSFDSVNMALAIEEFDPAKNQPQPPGYPFFVAEARIVQEIFRTPERTFEAIKIVICGLSVALLYLLGRRMFSVQAGAVAAILLFVNPVFWFSSLTSPLRPHLALVSILVAYFCWRTVTGESLYFYAASVALGLGGGFRPELSVLLLPLWIMAGWKTRERRTMIRGLLLVAAGTLAWLGVLAVLYHGVGRMAGEWIRYLTVQTQSSSILMGAGDAGWRRMVGRVFIWTGSGALAWLWTLPFGWRSRRELPGWMERAQFLAVWFVPPFLFQLLIHAANPGHMLSTIPVVCLVGGFCVAAADRYLYSYLQRSFAGGRLGTALQAGGLALAIAVAGNLILFFGRFPLPQASGEGHFRGLESLADAFRVGTYESSNAMVRWVDERTELGLDQIQRLQSETDRPVLVLWTRNGQPVWRKVSFYFPEQKVYELDEEGDPAVPASLGRLWSGNKVLAEYSGEPPFRVVIPKQARLIWLVGPNSIERLKKILPVKNAPPLSYVDMPADAPSFRWGSFEFVPSKN
jgi:hypothetical protein